MKVEILVDAGAFCERLGEDLGVARERAWVQTLSFEGDAAGTWLADAMLASPARDRRILVDSYTRLVISDRFLYKPANLLDAALRAEAKATRAMMRRLRAAGVDARYISPVGLFLRRMPSRDHKKIVLIDDDVSYIGGINFSDHNFAWHDLMLRIEDAGVAACLRADFEATCDGGGPGVHATFDGMELLSLDGVTNERLLTPVLERIAAARRSVVVHNAYVTFPFCEALREAASNGAQVRVITPVANNRGFLRDYMLWEGRRSGFEVLLYPERMSHLKAIVLDDETLIAGSSNFDWLTYRHQPELLAVITRPEVLAEFRERVLEPDLACCTVAGPPADPARGERADRVMRRVAAAAKIVCGRPKRPATLRPVRAAAGPVTAPTADPASRTRSP